MWERLSESAVTVMRLADEEAGLLGQPYVADEHLVLGMVRHGEGVAGRLLMDAGLTLQTARAELRALQAQGATPPPAPDAALVLRTVGVDLEMVPDRLVESFGADAVAVAWCRASRRHRWRRSGQRPPSLGGRAVFTKRALDCAARSAGDGEVGAEHLLHAVLEGLDLPLGAELSRPGRRHFAALGGTIGVTSPTLTLMRAARVDMDALRQRLSSWLGPQP